jgi:hypothetical protein
MKYICILLALSVLLNIFIIINRLNPLSCGTISFAELQKDIKSGALTIDQ